MTRMHKIIDEVIEERLWQKEYWGDEHDQIHEADDWVRFIDQRLNVLHDDIAIDSLRRRELFVHIAALAIAAIEAFELRDL